MSASPSSADLALGLGFPPAFAMAIPTKGGIAHRDRACYVTTPGSALLFPSLCRSTGALPSVLPGRGSDSRDPEGWEGRRRNVSLDNICVEAVMILVVVVVVADSQIPPRLLH